MRVKRARSKVAERLLAWLTTAGLIIISLFALFTVIFPLLLGATSYTVLTGSMKPSLEPGHLIGVRSTPITEISIGDIVTFQLESGKPTVATHRVVSVGFDGAGERILITKGDANNVTDAQPVREVQLRGVVVYAVPWFGYINALATPATKSAVMAAIGIAAMSWGVIVLGRDLFRKKRPARHSLAGALVLALVLTPLPEAQLAFATDPHSEPALQLSADGTNWVSVSSLALFQPGIVLSPGDYVNTALWIRNASPDTAELQLTATWMPTDASSASDNSLAEQLTTNLGGTPAHPKAAWHGGELAPGANHKIDVEARLPWPAVNGARNGSAYLVVTVQLTEIEAKLDNSALPSTGQSTLTLPFLISVAGIAVGILLILVDKRRRANKRLFGFQRGAATKFGDAFWRGDHTQGRGHCHL